jgi:hypothetical protein
MLSASVGTCLDALCSAAASTFVGSFGSAIGAACLLVVFTPADDGFLPAVISVDAELQFNKSTVDVTYYYLSLLLMFTQVGN